MSHEKNNGCNRVFEIFEQLSKIPRGSGHMNKISEFCTDFAKNHALNFVLDNAKNVIIYKPASHGFESAKPVILQGHLDMVWQKDKDSDIDFMKDGITPIND